jgi:phospholipid/cholesterol/gamma-HCH transport system ATP-binding protein
MITIENITKSFENTEVLHGISGVFEKGKTNMIIGASGTGKSVLLKCIVGLIDPDEGSVLYDKRDFTHANRSARIDIRREIGMLFQGAALFDSKTVQQNVKFPLDQLTSMHEDEKQDRVQLVLSRVGLPDAGKLMPSELSGGMKKRVGIARAIVNNSQYLFCDEPNSGLDPVTAIRIDNLIQEITKEFNITTVVVSHDMNSVMEIGEKVMFMYEGRKVWEGSNKNIMEAIEEELVDFIFANKMMQIVKDRISK